MTTFRDIVWGHDEKPDYLQEYVKDRCMRRRAEWQRIPFADARLEREIEQSWRDARRIAAERRRAEWREFRRDALLLLVVMAAVWLCFWMVSGQAWPL